jgi:hypothetical protein
MKRMEKKKWVTPVISKISIVRETKSGDINLVEIKQANSHAKPRLGKLLH